jgi:DnaJ-class molecular chaperone
VLGVSFEAGREKIRSAYEESKARYDPELVSYLGDEAQARFRLKADEVERAFQILTGARMN